MSKKSNWIWTTYFTLYLFLSGLNLFHFFRPDSPMSIYYHIAMAFDFHFFGVYFLNLTAVIFNALSLVPLYLYIYEIDFLDRRFWGCFLIFRLAFDILGHNYELNFIKSLVYENQTFGIKTLLASVILYLPCYMALFDYSFGRRNTKK